VKKAERIKNYSTKTGGGSKKTGETDHAGGGTGTSMGALTQNEEQNPQSQRLESSAKGKVFTSHRGGKSCIPNIGKWRKISKKKTQGEEIESAGGGRKIESWTRKGNGGKSRISAVALGFLSMSEKAVVELQKSNSGGGCENSQKWGRERE